MGLGKKSTVKLDSEIQNATAKDSIAILNIIIDKPVLNPLHSIAAHTISDRWLHRTRNERNR